MESPCPQGSPPPPLWDTGPGLEGHVALRRGLCEHKQRRTIWSRKDCQEVADPGVGAREHGGRERGSEPPTGTKKSRDSGPQTISYHIPGTSSVVHGLLESQAKAWERKRKSQCDIRGRWGTHRFPKYLLGTILPGLPLPPPPVLASEVVTWKR